jgi:allantoinase
MSVQPHRIAALRAFIDYVKAKPGVWWPTREEIARWYLGEAARHMKRR